MLARNIEATNVDEPNWILDPQVYRRPILRDPQWAVELKMNGRRLLAQAFGSGIRGFNRKGDRTDIPRQIGTELAVVSALDVALDGELMADGIFWVFDMPRCGGLVTTQTPWEDRRDTLQALIDSDLWQPQHIRVLPAARTTRAKRALVARIVKHGYEGYMLKRVTGPYREPRSRDDRSPDWLKVKNVRTVDCIVGSFGTDKQNVQLFVYEGAEPVPIGECSRLEGDAPKAEVGDVLEVAFLDAGKPDAPRLYQPHAKCLRQDKSPDECTIRQLDGCWAMKTVLV